MLSASVAWRNRLEMCWVVVAVMCLGQWGGIRVRQGNERTDVTALLRLWVFLLRLRSLANWPTHNNYHFMVTLKCVSKFKILPSVTYGFLSTFWTCENSDPSSFLDRKPMWVGRCMLYKDSIKKWCSSMVDRWMFMLKNRRVGLQLWLMKPKQRLKQRIKKIALDALFFNWHLCSSQLL